MVSQSNNRRIVPSTQATEKLHGQTRFHPILAILLAALIGLLAVWGDQVFRRPTFDERFQPAIEHPLKMHGLARDGFCFPGRCRIG